MTVREQEAAERQRDAAFVDARARYLRAVAARCAAEECAARARRAGFFVGTTTAQRVEEEAAEAYRAALAELAVVVPFAVHTTPVPAPNPAVALKGEPG
jgi:hypothetical protein